jgi:hypothetical protein
VAAVQARLALTELAQPVEMVAMAQPRLFLVVPSHTQAAAVGALAVGLLATVALAVAQTALHLQQILLLQQPIPAVVAAAVDLVARLNRKDQQAALASSSSSTTLALPQSLPSSHRRSGLHQRVR